MKVESILSLYSKTVEPVIKGLLASFVDKNHQGIIKYQVLTGGKRLRPALAIICCRQLGGQLKDVLSASAGLEILHNYTLIVDDIIDESTLRRGKPTLWAKFGTSIAQCLGADYAAAIFQSANKTKKHLEISEVFVKTLKAIIDGEIMDILFEQSGRKGEPYIAKNRFKNINERNYFKMAGKKTASLFEASCEVGGISAGGKYREVSALKNYGYNLGLAFQITDDTLDIFGKEKKFGKVIGGDIAERKLGNIVMLYALQEFKATDRQRFLQILRKEKISKNDIKKAVNLIKKTNGRERAESLAKKFIAEAKKSLNYLPQNQWNKLLHQIADSVLSRNK